MRFAFTDDQLAFRDAVRDMLKKECTPAVVRAAWDSDDGRAAGVWSQLGDMGVLGMSAPEAWGGLGMSALDMVLVLEESGRVALPEPLIETTAVAVPLLDEVGSDAIKDRWLGAAAAGNAIIAVGLAHSPYVVDAHIADLIVLERDGALFAVTPDDVTLTERPAVDRARKLFEVDLPPTTQTLAAGDAARAAVAAAYDRGALAAAAQLVGLSRHMIDMTVEYAGVRQQFGKPIGSFQAVKHRLADAQVAVEFARPLVYRAAYSVAHDDAERSLHVSMAKAYASEAAITASRAALQCHGAIGYSFEYDLHLWMKRAWCLAADWGSAEQHRARIGTAILGD